MRKFKRSITKAFVAGAVVLACASAPKTHALTNSLSTIVAVTDDVDAAGDHGLGVGLGFLGVGLVIGALGWGLSAAWKKKPR